MLNQRTARRLAAGIVGLAAYIAIGGCGSGGAAKVSRSSLLYVTDAVCNRVVRVNDPATGAWMHYGAIGDSVGQFDHPGGVFQDVHGRLFIADTGNGRIVSIDGIGGANWVSYSGAGSSIRAIRPKQAITDALGRIYIADAGGNGVTGRIVRIDDMSGANAVTYAPTSPFTPNPLALYGVSGIALDSQGRLYILEGGGNRLVRIDDFLNPTREELRAPASGALGFAGPMGVFIDAADRIYVADTANNRIVRFDDMTGAGWTTLGTLGSGINQFRGPSGIFVDSQGHIYVTDTGNNRVVRLNGLRGDTGFTVLHSIDAENFCSPVGIY